MVHENGRMNGGLCVTQGCKSKVLVRNSKWSAKDHRRLPAKLSINGCNTFAPPPKKKENKTQIRNITLNKSDNFSPVEMQLHLIPRFAV